MQTAVLADRVVSESGVAGVPDFANIRDVKPVLEWPRELPFVHLAL